MGAFKVWEGRTMPFIHSQPGGSTAYTPSPRRSSRKWAKYCRRRLGYHPTDKRLYINTGKQENRKFGNGGMFLANCSRVKYQLMKGRQG